MIYKNRLAPYGAIIAALFIPAVASNAQFTHTIAASVQTLPQWNLNRGHTKIVWGMSFSPDGKTLATASADRSLRLWDVASGVQQKAFGVADGTRGSLTSALFSRDGKTVYEAQATGDIVPWNISSGKRGRAIHTSRPSNPENTNSDPLGQVQLSPDGRTLWANNSDIISAWDLKRGTRIRSLNLADAQTAIASQIASQHSYDAELPTSAKSYWQLNLSGFTLSPDGRTVATGVSVLRVNPDRIVSSSSSFNQNDDFGSVICLWNAATGKLLRVFRETGRNISAIAFSADGKMLAAGGELLVSDESRINRLPGVVRVWDAQSGQLRHMLHGADGDVRAIAFSQDGHLVSGDLTGAVTVWKLTTEKVIYQWQEGIKSPYGNSRDWINAVAFSPQGDTLAITFNGSVRLRQFPSGELLHDLSRENDASIPIAFSPDGKILFARHGWQSVALWDVKEAALIRVIQLSKNPLDYLESIVLSPDGKTIASTLFRHEGLTYDKYKTEIQLWDVDTGQPRDLSMVVDGKLHALTFSPDSSRLAIGHQFYLPLPQENQRYAGFPIKRDNNGRVLMWDLKRNAKLWQHDEKVGGQGEIAFSPDGTQLAMPCWENTNTGLREPFSDRPIISSRGNVRIMDTETGVLKQALALQDNISSYVALIPESSYKNGYTAEFHSKSKTNLSLFTTGGRSLNIWDLGTGALSKSIADVSGGIAISPDGNGAAITYPRRYVESSNGVVTVLRPSSVEIRRIFPSSNYEQITLLPDAGDAVFSPEGKTIAAADSNGISLWKINGGQKLVTFATITSAPAVTSTQLPTWIAFTPNHEYTGSVGSERYLQELNGDILSPAKTLGLRQPEKVRQSIAGQ